MTNDTTIPFLNPASRDEMTDLIRAHAQTALRQAVLAELDAFLSKYDDTDDLGRRNMDRNGYQPERGPDRRRASDRSTAQDARLFQPGALLPVTDPAAVPEEDPAA